MIIGTLPRIQSEDLIQLHQNRVAISHCWALRYCIAVDMWLVTPNADTAQYRNAKIRVAARILQQRGKIPL